MKAVYKRELRSYFNSMTGYVFLAVVMLFIGIMFSITNLSQGYPYFTSTLSNTTIIFIFAIPILTMRSMAEERKSKTDQLLLTYPVTVPSVILGKYFAMLTIYVIPLLISCICPLIIAFGGSGSFLIDYSSIFAYLCLGCMFIAIGMFISSLTESQVIAVIVSIGVSLLLYMWSSLSSFVPKTAAASLVGFLIILAVILLLLQNLTKNRILTVVVGVVGLGVIIALDVLKNSLFSGLLSGFLDTFSIMTALNNFTNYHVFDLKGVVFFLTFAAMFVFLTVQSVQKRRWS